MRDVELDSFCCSGSWVGEMAGSCAGVPERTLVWCRGAGDDDFGPGDLGGAVDEEVFQQGGGEGHLAVGEVEKAGYGGLIFGAEGGQEGEGGIGRG